MIVVHAPAGSHIGVDGQEYVAGEQPLRIDVAGGEHRVVVAAPHKLVWSGKVHVAAGAGVEVRPNLLRTRPPRAGAATTTTTTTTPAAPGGDAQKNEPQKKSGDYTLDPF